MDNALLTNVLDARIPPHPCHLAGWPLSLGTHRLSFRISESVITGRVTPKTSKEAQRIFVKTVNRPGRYGDGRGGFGLSLLVKPTSTGRLSKTWSQRLRVHGRPVNVGLGAYPIVTLAEARRAAVANRREVAQGRVRRSYFVGQSEGKVKVYSEWL